MREGREMKPTSGYLVRLLSGPRLSVCPVLSSFAAHTGSSLTFAFSRCGQPLLSRSSKGKGGNACLIIYAAQVAWNFTSELCHTCPHAFSRVDTRPRARLGAHTHTHTHVHQRIGVYVYCVGRSRRCGCSHMYVCVHTCEYTCMCTLRTEGELPR